MAENKAAGLAAIVITGGAPLDRRVLARLPREGFVIAADGGLDHALAAGLSPDALVGDLDSVSAGALAWADEHIAVIRHSADKATTDTELALAHALTRTPNRIVLVAGGGDRLDHTVAALGALGSPALSRVDRVEAWWGGDHVVVAIPQRSASLAAAVGTTFSVLALHGPARGVSITGARWPLHRVTLPPVVGCGVSNAVLDPPVEVSVEHGVLTVIVPGAEP